VSEALDDDTLPLLLLFQRGICGRVLQQPSQ